MKTNFAVKKGTISLLVPTIVACLAVLPGVVPALGQFSFKAARYDSDSYWTDNCVVIARIVEVRTSAQQFSDNAVVIRPLGTLSGRFDAGKNLRINVKGSFPVTRLHNGDTTLISLLNPRVSRPEAAIAEPYLIDDPPFPYMPEEYDAAEIITGFSDPKVQDTLSRIQKLRRKPTVNQGEGLAYWRCHSVVYAKVGGASRQVNRLQCYTFFVLGSLSGGYDAGKTSKISIVLDDDTTLRMLDERVRQIHAGDTVLLLCAEDASNGHWYIPEERAAFMPFTHDPIIHVSTGGEFVFYPNKGVGETIDGALREIRKRRVGQETRAPGREHAAPLATAIAYTDAAGQYWENHSLVYADVAGVTEQSGQSYVFELRPKLVLSGAFDAGKTPKVSASASMKTLGQNFKPPSAGSKVLVLLLRIGDSYSVSPEHPDFMPSSHAPICTVNSLDDPKVPDALEAVQKLRHAAAATKPDPSPKNDAAKR
jgi:hypothetical protein